MLHIRCGDDIRDKLAAAGLPGEFLRWADPLCQGPTPAGLEPAAWQTMRAAFLARRYRLADEAAARYLAAQDEGLAAAGAHDEIVLWFEHDLFDQVILVHLLDRFARRPPGDARLSLVCIDRHPAVPRFIGLGQLSSRQLADLFPARAPVTSEQLQLARRAWAAFTSPDPTAIEALIAGDTTALPFLAAALGRHLADFPAAGTGLARTQELVLEAVSQGAADPVAVFHAVQALEPAPWLGDSMLWPWLDGLARGPVAALAIGGPDDWAARAPDLSAVPVRLTRAGHQLFYGELDWVDANGIDRWLGGVHLTGKESIWRRDPARGRLVRAD